MWKFVFLPSHNGSYSAEAALTVELQGHLQMLWLFFAVATSVPMWVLFSFILEVKETSAPSIFFFPLQQIKSGIHKNKFAALLFVSKFRIFCSVNIGDIICAITWNFNLISYCHISYI